MSEPRTKVLVITLLQGKFYQTSQNAHGVLMDSMDSMSTPWEGVGDCKIQYR